MSKGILKVKIIGDAAGLKGTLDESSGALGKFGKLATRALVVGGAAAAGGLAAVAKAGFDFNSSIQQTTISLGTMLGSQEKANALIGEMTAFAAETPFEFPELADATKKLIAFGFEGKDIIPTMTTLGDLAAGLNIPVGELSELYGKAKVQGRLYMEDINQLTGRGIPVIQEFAKQFGVSEGEVRKLVEEGKIGFPQLEKALSGLTGEGGKFGGLMEQQSKSFAGQISTIKDSFAQLAGKLTAPAFEWISGTILPKLISGADALMQKLSGASGPLGVFTGLWERVAPILQPVVDMFGRLFAHLQNSGIGFGQVSTALSALNPILGIFKEFWPALLPLIEQVGKLLIDLAAQVLPIFTKAWELLMEIVTPILDELLALVMDVFPTILATITDVMNAILPVVKMVLGNIKAFWDEHGAAIMEIVKTVFGFVREFIEAVMKIISGVIKTITAIIRGDWSAAWEGIKQIFSGVWEAMEAIVSAAMTIIEGALSAAWNGIKSLLSGIWTGIKDAFGKLWEGMKTVWEEATGWIKDIPNKIKGFFSGAGQWLWNIGKDILAGLWNGLKEKWESVASWFKGLGSKIKSLKGPIEKDRVMLRDEGAAIISGLAKGMQSAWPDVERTLSGMNTKLSGGVTASGSGGSTVNNNQRQVTIYVSGSSGLDIGRQIATALAGV